MHLAEVLALVVSVRIEPFHGIFVQNLCHLLIPIRTLHTKHPKTPMRLLFMNRVGARSKEEKVEEAAAAVGYDALQRSASIQSSMPSCGKFQERFRDNFVSFAAST